ncbi:MAG: hypothetical protein JXA37_04730 [Chloroflexia bacterium]|nr:hypothetical protein [Chloroflexia bacterium]
MKKLAWLLRSTWLLPALALCLHLVLVYSIARQPLDINRQPGAQRSLIWPLHNDTVHRRGPGADLFAVYHAGQALRAGLSPYESAESPQRTPYFYPFRYLPLIGQTLGRFLSCFSPRLAYWIWVVLLELSLAVFLLAFNRRLPDPGRRCFSTCLLLLSSPYLLELHLGQFTFLTLTLLSLALLVQEYPRGWLRGLWARGFGALSYTASLLLKFFPLVTFAALLRHRRYLAHLALATLLLALAIPYFMAHPPDLNIFYAKNVANLSGGMDSGNFGLVYLFYLVAQDTGADWILEQWPAWTSLWRLAILGPSTLIVLLSRDRRVILGAGTMVFAHLVSTSQVWEHHLSGAIVVGFLLWFELGKEQEGRPRALPLLLAAGLLLLALPTPFALLDQAKDPSLWDPSVDWPAYARYLLILPKVLPTVLIYLSSLLVLLKSGLHLPLWPTAGR